MRFENWPLLLEEELIKHQNTAFVWGESDCWLFVASCVKAMTGIDPAQGLRGMYSTEQEAIKIIDSYGGIDDLLQTLIFEKYKNRLYAQRGDIVTLEVTDFDIKAGGICVGAHAAFMGLKGLSMVKLAHCDSAYKVK